MTYPRWRSEFISLAFSQRISPQKHQRNPQDPPVHRVHAPWIELLALSVFRLRFFPKLDFPTIGQKAL
jgi:hypothetical protein